MQLIPDGRKENGVFPLVRNVARSDNNLELPNKSEWNARNPSGLKKTVSCRKNRGSSSEKSTCNLGARRSDDCSDLTGHAPHQRYLPLQWQCASGLAQRRRAAYCAISVSAVQTARSAELLRFNIALTPVLCGDSSNTAQHNLHGSSHQQQDSCRLSPPNPEVCPRLSAETGPRQRRSGT